MPYSSVCSGLEAPAATGAPFLCCSKCHFRPNAQLPDTLQGAVVLNRAYDLCAVSTAYSPESIGLDIITVLNWYRLRVFRGSSMAIELPLCQMPIGPPNHPDNQNPPGIGAGLQFRRGDSARFLLQHDRQRSELVPYIRARRDRGAGVNLKVCLWLLPV